MHSHTTCSDGTLTPAELVMRAEVKNIDVLSITDHDCIDAIEPSIEYIKQNQLKLNLVSGVEISTQWHGFEIHILGYAIELKDPKLQDFLSKQRVKRIDRAKRIGEKLAKKGMADVYPLAMKLASGRIISRTHFAQALVDLGHVPSFDQAFRKYLAKGKGAYVSAEWATIEQAVEVISQSGGLAVIAHPARYDMTNKWLRKLVFEFSEAGGVGLEVGLSRLNPDHKKFIVSLAKEHGLYSSLGSDFHAPNKWTELGRGISLTEECIPIWTHADWRTIDLSEGQTL